jgi:hypothetical protein
MDCPVCGAEAEAIPATIIDLRILCPACGEYDVSTTVISTGQLQSLEPDQRREILDMAKHAAPPGARPMITTYLLANQHRRASS